MNLAMSENDKQLNGGLIKTFDKFCIESCRLEAVFNKANTSAFELKNEVEELLFLVEKRQKVLFGVDVFLSVGRKKDILALFEAETAVHVTFFDVGEVIVKYLRHR